jgi:hypothetical protein
MNRPTTNKLIALLDTYAEAKWRAGNAGAWSDAATNEARAAMISALRELEDAAPQAQPNDFRDAYEGAREDLLDWKRRALEAEAKLRDTTQYPDDRVEAAIAILAAAPQAQPEPQGWHDLAQRCLTAMESAIHFRETGQGRPPEQTCRIEVEELRAMLKSAEITIR